MLHIEVSQYLVVISLHLRGDLHHALNLARGQVPDSLRGGDVSGTHVTSDTGVPMQRTSHLHIRLFTGDHVWGASDTFGGVATHIECERDTPA